MSFCDDPKRVEMMLRLRPYARQLDKLHLGVLSDIGPRAWVPGIDETPPYLLGVEYGTQAFVYVWDGKKLSPASAKQFADFVHSLTKRAQKRLGWRNPCELKRRKVVKASWVIVD